MRSTQLWPPVIATPLVKSRLFTAQEVDKFFFSLPLIHNSKDRLFKKKKKDCLKPPTSSSDGMYLNLNITLPSSFLSTFTTAPTGGISRSNHSRIQQLVEDKSHASPVEPSSPNDVARIICHGTNWTGFSKELEGKNQTNQILSGSCK